MSNRHLLVDAEWLGRHLGESGMVVVDTRRLSERLATEVRSARGGTIPGSVHVEHTRNLDAGRFKSDDELRAMYEAAGATPDKEIIPLCHGGYRSAHTYLALRLLGYPRLRNYAPSWYEWGNRDDLPIELPGAGEE